MSPYLTRKFRSAPQTRTHYFNPFFLDRVSVLPSFNFLFLLNLFVACVPEASLIVVLLFFIHTQKRRLLLMGGLIICPFSKHSDFESAQACKRDSWPANGSRVLGSQR